jgi:D-glycero-D-manno-heptose 1,7-bisphosphate phosphatase
VAVATNQSGIARGLFDLETLEQMHQHLDELVDANGGRLAGIFYCAHHPDDDCDCRKPKPGLIRAIEAELGESPLGAWFIGDTLRDLEAAEAAGCEPVLVLTGKGARTWAQISADPDSHWQGVRVYPDLAAAAAAVIRHGEDA